MSCCSLVSVKISVQTKIRYKGLEYSTPDELPADAHSAYEQAIARGTHAAPNGDMTTGPIFNGDSFDSPIDVPPAKRKVYEDAMQLARNEARPKPEPGTDTGRPTKRQMRLIILLAEVLLAAAIVIASLKLAV
ncbi:MAG: hypothetical protein QOI34_1808 [Verrucomicrobiota bacterium]